VPAHLVAYAALVQHPVQVRGGADGAAVDGGDDVAQHQAAGTRGEVARLNRHGRMDSVGMAAEDQAGDPAAGQ
jgi:hypothetical protein